MLKRFGRPKIRRNDLATAHFEEIRTILHAIPSDSHICALSRIAVRRRVLQKNDFGDPLGFQIVDKRVFGPPAYPGKTLNKWLAVGDCRWLHCLAFADDQNPHGARRSYRTAFGTTLCPVPARDKSG